MRTTDIASAAPGEIEGNSFTYTRDCVQGRKRVLAVRGHPGSVGRFFSSSLPDAKLPT